MRIRPLYRVTVAALTLACFSIQSLFAYSAESNLWAARRRRVRDPHSSEEAIQLAASPGAADSAQILGQLPAPQRQTLSPQVAQNLPKGFAEQHAALLETLPYQYGTVRKISLPSSRSPASPVIIHIQDVHQNLEAQKNIGGAVGALIAGKVAGLVALEGDSDPIDLSRYRAFADRDTIQQVADYLLKENKISGPIHAVMTGSGESPAVLGIDDGAHYAANVEAYRRSAPHQAEMKARLAAQAAELDQRKSAAFNAELKAYDDKVTAYRSGKSPLVDYVRVLSSVSPPPAPVSRFLEALAMEDSIDFKQVESERARLIESLARKLSKDQIAALVNRTAAYRLGQIRYADFYSSLRDLCKNAGVSLSRFPAVDAYIRYVLLADAVDAEALFAGMGTMEKAGYDRLARSAIERRLVAESKGLCLGSKLADFALTPEEWREYKNVERESAGREGGPDISSFESFYEEAQIRDEAMTENLLKSMKVLGAKSAILVTGGFHSAAMDERLARAGMTVISFTPKIEKVDTENGSAYLSVFTQEKSPLEKLFEGRKLFLADSSVRGIKSVEAALMVTGMEAWKWKKVDTDHATRCLESVAPEFIKAGGNLLKVEATADNVVMTIKIPGREPLKITLGIQGDKITSFNGEPAGSFLGGPLDTLSKQIGNMRERLLLPVAAGTAEECRRLAPSAASVLRTISHEELSMFARMQERGVEGWIAPLAHHGITNPREAVLDVVGMLGMALRELLAPVAPGAANATEEALNKANEEAHTTYDTMALQFGWPLLALPGVNAESPPPPPLKIPGGFDFPGVPEGFRQEGPDDAVRAYTHAELFRSEKNIPAALDAYRNCLRIVENLGQILKDNRRTHGSPDWFKEREIFVTSLLLHALFGMARVYDEMNDHVNLRLTMALIMEKEKGIPLPIDLRIHIWGYQSNILISDGKRDEGAALLARAATGLRLLEEIAETSVLPTKTKKKLPEEKKPAALYARLNDTGLLLQENERENLPTLVKEAPFLSLTLEAHMLLFRALFFGLKWDIPHENINRVIGIIERLKELDPPNAARLDRDEAMIRVIAGWTLYDRGEYERAAEVSAGIDDARMRSGQPETETAVLNMLGIAGPLVLLTSAREDQRNGRIRLGLQEVREALVDFLKIFHVQSAEPTHAALLKALRVLPIRNPLEFGCLAEFLIAAAELEIMYGRPREAEEYLELADQTGVGAARIAFLRQAANNPPAGTIPAAFQALSADDRLRLEAFHQGTPNFEKRAQSWEAQLGIPIERDPLSRGLVEELEKGAVSTSDGTKPTSRKDLVTRLLAKSDYVVKRPDGAESLLKFGPDSHYFHFFSSLAEAADKSGRSLEVVEGVLVLLMRNNLHVDREGIARVCRLIEKSSLTDDELAAAVQGEFGFQSVSAVVQRSGPAATAPSTPSGRKPDLDSVRLRVELAKKRILSAEGGTKGDYRVLIGALGVKDPEIDRSVLGIIASGSNPSGIQANMSQVLAMISSIFIRSQEREDIVRYMRILAPDIDQMKDGRWKEKILAELSKAAKRNETFRRALDSLKTDPETAVAGFALAVVNMASAGRGSSGSVLSARTNPWYYGNAESVETRGWLWGLGAFAQGILPFAGLILWVAHAGEPLVRGWRSAEGPWPVKLSAALRAAAGRLFQTDLMIVVLGTTVLGLIPFHDFGLFVGVVEIFARVHKLVNRMAAEAGVLAVLPGRTPEDWKEKAGPYLKALFEQDRLPLGLKNFGSPTADPQTVAASMAARVQSKNPLMRRLARRLLKEAGVPVERFVEGSMETLDGLSAAQFQETTDGQAVGVFVPHDFQPDQVRALLIFARTRPLVLVAEERDESSLRDLQRETGFGDLKIRPVPDGSFKPREGGPGFVLELPSDDRLSSNDRWRELSASLPLGRAPLSLGSLTLNGVPGDAALHAFADAVQDLLRLMPSLTLRAETIVNLRAIAAALTAA
jgi:hypothetical protein